MAKAASTKPKSVYALVGSDTFLQLEAQRNIVASFGAETQRNDFDGNEDDLGDVLGAVQTFSMFASATVAVVRNADALITKSREGLQSFVKSGGSSAGTLILRCESLPKNQNIYKEIVRVGEVIACDAPSGPAALASWATRRAERFHQISLTQPAAARLAELIGPDLARMDSELAKLALQADDAPVDAALVDRSVVFQREQEMFELTNELAAGRTPDAIKRWKLLMQTDPTSEFRAVVWIGLWLDDVWTFLTNRPAFKNTWRYKTNFPLFQRHAQSIGRRGAARLIRALAKVDRDSKTGVGNMADNIERFMLGQ